MGFPLKTCSHILPSAVGRITFWLCCTMFSHGPMRNMWFPGRWGTYACPQCLPSDTVPIRSWTRTLRPPDIRHRHLPHHGHTMPCHTIPYHDTIPYHTGNNCQTAPRCAPKYFVESFRMCLWGDVWLVASSGWLPSGASHVKNKPFL